MKTNITINPKLDLVLERNTDIKPELIWKAWTEPKLLMQWFCPKPWKTIEAELDLRPGGKFHSVMQSPEGQNFPNMGCFLSVEPGTQMIWTSALLPGFRPAPKSDNPHDLLFTAVVNIEPNGSGGTKYTAIAIHQDEVGKKAHEQMGFHEGWGATFDQMVQLIKTM